MLLRVLGQLRQDYPTNQVNQEINTWMKANPTEAESINWKPKN
jgi:hypothetical protein